MSRVIDVETYGKKDFKKEPLRRKGMDNFQYAYFLQGLTIGSIVGMCGVGFVSSGFNGFMIGLVLSFMIGFVYMKSGHQTFISENERRVK